MYRIYSPNTVEDLIQRIRAQKAGAWAQLRGVSIEGKDPNAGVTLDMLRQLFATDRGDADMGEEKASSDDVMDTSDYYNW